MDQVLEKNNAFELADLDFREARENIPTPDQIPENTDVTRDIPLEIKRSATVEALLAQNDDLMARLKVNLRRLTLLENDNERLRKAMLALEGQNHALADQRDIWEEKQNNWKEKERQLEDIVAEFQTRLPNYENMVEKVEQFKAYQERVRTQVKPFIHQLKSYAENLAAEVQKLNVELAEREADIKNLRERQVSAEAEIDRVRVQAESRQALLSEHHERLQQQAVLEIRELNAQVSRLESRCQDYDEQRAREAELTNVVVALRRQKEDLVRENQETEQTLRQEVGQLRAEVARLEATSNDEIQKSEALRTEHERHLSQNHQLQEQLSSLRYLWNAKTEECEKMKASMSSMERLNAELSRQLSDLRRDSENEGR